MRKASLASYIFAGLVTISALTSNVACIQQGPKQQQGMFLAETSVE